MPARSSMLKDFYKIKLLTDCLTLMVSDLMCLITGGHTGTDGNRSKYQTIYRRSTLVRGVPSYVHTCIVRTHVKQCEKCTYWLIRIIFIILHFDCLDYKVKIHGLILWFCITFIVFLGSLQYGRKVSKLQPEMQGRHRYKFQLTGSIPLG